MSGASELILIFVAVICMVLSAAYFYETSDVFTEALRKPFRFISAGVMAIAAGVLIAAVISYTEKLGININFYGFPLQVYFYILYIVGAVLIFIGARKLVNKPLKIAYFI